MANNYATVPAIIPGDLKIQGKLTVASGQFILGQFPRKYRIQELANGEFVETVNIDRIAVVQDDPTFTSLVRVIYPANNPFQVGQQAPGVPGTDNWLLVWINNEFWVAQPTVRVGTALPYARLIQLSATSGGITYNLQSDGLTRDDATKPAFELLYDSSTSQFTSAVIDAANNKFFSDPRRVFWLDHTLHHITGVTGLQTVASKTVLGNQLGPNGAILLRITGDISTSATGTIPLALSWGGTAIALFTLPAASLIGFWVEALIQNANSTASQYVGGSGGYSSTSVTMPNTQTTINTTANQVLSITASPTDTANVMDIKFIEAEYLARATGL